MIKVKDDTSLARDPKTKAVINNDQNAFERARAAKNKALEKEQRLSNLENEVSEMKYALNEILKTVKNNEGDE